MTRSALMCGVGGVALLGAALSLPALARDADDARALPPMSGRTIGTFTPAVSDPRLAAVLARRAPTLNSFRFTPATTDNERPRAVRVAVRARTGTPAEAARGIVDTSSAGGVTAITPSQYNLGVSIGWRRFAVTGDVVESEGGALPGARRSAELGVNYRATPRITGRVAVAAERSEGVQRVVNPDAAYSLDVGGSYSIARNIDLTAGARYRVQRDRLEPLAQDQRRDSQAVYIGTAFRF